MNKQPAPTIKIYGRVCSGKTTLAYKIKEVLKLYDIDVNIMEYPEDGDGEQVVETLESRLESLKGKTVDLEVFQTVSRMCDD
jgi:adenylate kinase family enzyme